LYPKFRYIISSVKLFSFTYSENFFSKFLQILSFVVHIYIIKTSLSVKTVFKLSYFTSRSADVITGVFVLLSLSLAGFALMSKAEDCVDNKNGTATCQVMGQEMEIEDMFLTEDQYKK
jgi:hypothetical protein